MFNIFQDHWRCADEIREIFPVKFDASWRQGLPSLGGTGDFQPWPHDPGDLIGTLRREGYLDNSLENIVGGGGMKSLIRKAYYFMRPLFPVGVRKHMQRLALRGWDKIPFPAWPVDTSVDDLLRETWRPILAKAGVERLPFIWFWPDGHRYAGILTHDIETAAGRDYCDSLMRMEAEFKLVSSFEVVPEEQYEVPDSFLESIRAGGCEVCLHGLNHDGHLFTNRSEFLRRADLIRQHGERFGAVGFRSPVMYRQLEWINELPIEYDMSLPNVGHLDPQRGGCCTLFPFSLGKVLELPQTTIQDYPLYNILGQYNMELWLAQAEIVRRNHGLLSFIIHPDYTTSSRPQALYRKLLAFLAEERRENGLWLPLPRDLNEWWRLRGKMRLVAEKGGWTITGEGSERARLAYVVLENGAIKSELD